MLRIKCFCVNLRLVNMANIVITNLCNQSCLYCFAVDEFGKDKRQEIRILKGSPVSFDVLLRVGFLYFLKYFNKIPITLSMFPGFFPIFN